MKGKYCELVCQNNPHGKAEIEQLKVVIAYLRRQGINDVSPVTDDLRSIRKDAETYFDTSLMVIPRCQVGIGCCDVVSRLRHEATNSCNHATLLIVKYIQSKPNNIGELLRLLQGHFPRGYKATERYYKKIMSA